MDETLQQQLTQRLAELPPDIQAAVQSADLLKKIQAIGQKYQLHVDQIGLLDDEIMLVMLGFSDPKEFVTNLVAQVRIPAATAALIATDVSNELFVPIRESMQHFAEARESQDKAVPPVATPVPTPPPVPPKPKPEFPKADIMLTQKTVMPPASAPGASTAHETSVAVPPKLVPMTTPPPAMSKTPSAPVPTPAQPAHPAPPTAPPMTTLPPKIPSGTAPTPATPPAAPAPAAASASNQPTPTPAETTTPPSAQNTYKTDPYREPIE